MASHQPPVSPFKALGLGLAAGWVGILATLDVYSTASHSAQALPDHVELRNLPQSFSFAALLSPSTPGQLATVTYGKQPLHSSYLVCLALNEECRAMKRGGFYYLPVQDRPASRPCDLVFVDESWGARSIKTWDESKWGERLTMFPALKKIDPGEDVIPICTRILQFGSQSRLGTTDDDEEHSTNKLSQHVYSSTFDPAITANVYQYSRPIECLSTVLLTYNSRISTPFVCLAGAAEDETFCVRFPTPNSLSETFVRRGVLHSDVQRRAQFGDPAAELVVLGDVSSHQDVIRSMLQLWENSKDRRHADMKLFGRVSYKWQEIINVMEGFDCYDRFPDLAFWPRA